MAKEIAIDDSKCLRFACGETCLPDWERFHDREMLLAYINTVKESSCGPDGIVPKLDAIEPGLHFVRVTLTKDDEITKRHNRCL